MNCFFCGNELQEEDAFCGYCGHHRDETPSCPSCGALLQRNLSFCTKCGYKLEKETSMTEIPEDEEIPITKMETIDIPFDVIEQTILADVQKQVVGEMYAAEASEPQRKRDAEEIDEAGAPGRHRKHSSVDPQAVGGQEYRMKRKERGLHSERTDYENDVTDEEDDEDDDSPLTRLTVILGILIAVIFVAGGFLLWKNNHELKAKPAPATVENESDAGEDDSAESGDTSAVLKVIGKIKTTSDVNIRNGADKSSEKLGVAAKGDIYFYTEVVGGWYHIQLEDGTYGYIYGDYAEIVK